MLLASGTLTEQQLGPRPEWTGGLQVSRHRKRGVHAHPDQGAHAVQLSFALTGRPSKAAAAKQAAGCYCAVGSAQEVSQGIGATIPLTP